jgi:hypothetical protein
MGLSTEVGHGAMLDSEKHDEVNLEVRERRDSLFAMDIVRKLGAG